MNAPAGNLAPALVPREGKCSEDCEGKNDRRTDALRRALLYHMTYGSEPYLSRVSGVCISSVRKQAEGEHRMSAPLLRSMLLLAPPDEAAELLSVWLGLPLAHRP